MGEEVAKTYHSYHLLPQSIMREEDAMKGKHNGFKNQDSMSFLFF